MTESNVESVGKIQKFGVLVSRASKGNNKNQRSITSVGSLVQKHEQIFPTGSLLKTKNGTCTLYMGQRNNYLSTDNKQHHESNKMFSPV